TGPAIDAARAVGEAAAVEDQAAWSFGQDRLFQRRRRACALDELPVDAVPGPGVVQPDEVGGHQAAEEEDATAEWIERHRRFHAHTRGETVRRDLFRALGIDPPQITEAAAGVVT